MDSTNLESRNPFSDSCSLQRIDITVVSRRRILCVYSPPICSNHCNEHICQLLSHCSRNMTNVIIIGDFNLPLIDWSNNVSPITRQYNLPIIELAMWLARMYVSHVLDRKLLERLMSPSPKSQVMFAQAFS